MDGSVSPLLWWIPPAIAAVVALFVYLAAKEEMANWEKDRKYRRWRD